MKQTQQIHLCFCTSFRIQMDLKTKNHLYVPLAADNTKNVDKQLPTNYHPTQHFWVILSTATECSAVATKTPKYAKQI